MSLTAILDALARDAACHMTGEPAGEEELRGLEATLGHPLPASFRALLSRFGGGVFYQGHEIFGPRRLMIHDIELVPSLPSMLSRLRAEKDPIPPGVVPFHRMDGLIHLLDMRDPAAPERVVALPGSPAYPDLATFLRTVLLPPAPSVRA